MLYIVRRCVTEVNNMILLEIIFCRTLSVHGKNGHSCRFFSDFFVIGNFFCRAGQRTTGFPAKNQRQLVAGTREPVAYQVA